ncbi:MAG: hypothetical protein HUU37_10010 [Bdellovibrionales bacterium]|nr:hypothetical protein [Bdellovibrionales bacterium]
MRLLFPFLFLVMPALAGAAELIAFRGVHANFKPFLLGADHCTAIRIEKSGHSFVENTIASIQEAFRSGAKVVTVDVQPTLENDLSRETLVAFSDETLDCRAVTDCLGGCKCGKEKKCWVRDQSLEFLRKLDIGSGYTFDGGATYPYRGRMGMMPTIGEIFDTMSLFLDQEIWLNRIDPEGRAGKILLRELKLRDPSLARRLRMNFDGIPPDEARSLRSLGVQDAAVMGEAAARCLSRYVLLGWSGYFPAACRGTSIVVPTRESLGRFFPPLAMFDVTDLLWGWPVQFLLQAAKHDLRVVASQVNTPEDLKAAMDLPLAGIMTSKVEEVGPLYRKYSAAEQ